MSNHPIDQIHPPGCALAFWAGIIVIAAFGLVLGFCAATARAHDALPTAAQPLGWLYGYECCSLADCREVPANAIEEGPKGYVIKATGEVIPYGDRKIKQSKDDRFHWCSRGGKPDTPTICLYVPARSF